MLASSLNTTNGSETQNGKKRKRFNWITSLSLSLSSQSNHSLNGASDGGGGGGRASQPMKSVMNVTVEKLGKKNILLRNFLFHRIGGSLWIEF